MVVTYQGLWTFERLIDSIFIDLMESKEKDMYDNGNKRLNNYVLQIIQKIKFFLIKSPSVCFDINYKDLKEETIKQLEEYTKDCKTVQEKYRKLDGIIVEAIARITKEAEPLILSIYASEDDLFLRVSLNQIRQSVSFKWRFVY